VVYKKEEVVVPKAFNPKSVALLRKRGYHSENTEHWNAYAKIAQDLLGFVDVIAVGKGEMLLVQVTAWGSISNRLRKIRESDNARACIKVPGVHIVIHGWKKTVTAGGAVRWKVKEREVIFTDFWGVRDESSN
jgi:hypothetical protein